MPDDTAVSYAKTAEPIDTLFWLWTQVSQRSMCCMEVHISDTRLNRTCAAAMRTCQISGTWCRIGFAVGVLETELDKLESCRMSRQS